MIIELEEFLDARDRLNATLLPHLDPKYVPRWNELLWRSRNLHRAVLELEERYRKAVERLHELETKDVQPAK